MEKTAVVVNPMAAGGKLGKRWPDVARVLGRELGAFETLTTQASRDATRLTRDALRGGADVVVAIGGDGTIHEVANGFFDDGKPIRPAAALAVIPYGTGGDFRKSIDMPTDVAAAAAIIKKGHTRDIDVGRLTYTTRGGTESSMFINIASFGIGGRVDQLVNTSSKMWDGKTAFMLATLRATFTYKNQKVRMVFDGKEDAFVELTINSVAVANGRYFGGGMKMAPNAELDDGQFDVVAVGDVGIWDLVTKAGHLYKGTHLTLPKVSSWRAARVDARPVVAGDEVLLDVDGEAPGHLPATFVLLPRALKVVVPNG